jgi:tetratricopeptide (TPR) repeat protein/DNA-binding SARP family transcriptional activator
VLFSLLGDVTAHHGGQFLSLGGKQRAVLAVLLYEPNKVVRRTEIVRLAWGTHPDDVPDTIDRLVADYMYQLRKAFHRAGAGAEVRLHARQPGYLLEVDDQTIDWHRFCDLVDQAQRANEAGELTDAVRLLREGLDLWRGPPLADVGPTLDPIRTQMEERRIAAIEALAAVELARGGSDRVLPLLIERAADHPAREQLVALLIQALHAAGRRDDAIAAYLRCRQHLDTLGLEPTHAIEEAYQAVLNGHQPGRRTAAPAGPAQLPLDTTNFVGRADELRELLEFVPAEPAGATRAPGPSVICLVYGMAGVGKTTFAVHAAHRMARWFPDGQLFLDLQGYTANGPRVGPAEALDRLLRAIGVMGDRIPQHLDDRAALYRDRLAGRRTLILLDNAYKADQVRPLLPAGPGCLVLVTSRRRLTALDDAHPLPLETLPAADSVALFGRVGGQDRLRGQQDAVERIADLCGGLPLAIRIVAARFRTHPAWQLRHLAKRLSDAQGQPWELDDGERSIAAAFRLSYEDLTDVHQRMFRLLSLAPGRDIEAYAAAALTETPPGPAARLLQDLLDANLLGQQVEGRYLFHDLMRSFAADLANTEDSPTDRAAALARLLDHQLHTAAAAMDVAFPHEQHRRPRLPAPSRPIPPIPSPAEARAMLDAERANLIAAASAAAEHGWPDQIRKLDDTLFRHLITGAHYEDALVLHGLVLRAAREQGDRSGEATALDHMGQVQRRLGQYELALEHFQQALTAHREVGDRTQEAIMLTNIGVIRGLHGTYDQALDHLQEALELTRQVGDLANESNTLANIGNLHLYRGNYDEALDQYQHALSIFAEIGNRSGTGIVLTCVGEVHERQGRHDLALDHHRQALRIFGAIGDRAGEAMALTNLGRMHERRGHYDLALRHQRQALAVFRAIGHQAGQSETLSQLASLYAVIRQYADSIANGEQALTIAREIGDRTLEATILNRLGITFGASGQHAAALASHRSALTLAQRLGNRAEQACAHEGIGDLLQEDGRQAAAQSHWRSAFGIYADMGVPEADRIQGKLHRTPPTR